MSIVLSEENFGKFSGDKVREAALLELALNDITNRINSYYEAIYLEIQKQREIKESNKQYDASGNLYRE